jgi:opacity protein-like surface antigen
MRRFLFAAMCVGLAGGAPAPAAAADLSDIPFLRGALTERAPLSRTVWQGFYAGGQAGYGTSDADFTNSTRDLAARMLAVTALETEGQVSTWPLMGRVSKHGTGFGAFAGYNMQWDDAVIGFEANYLHGAFGGSDSDSMSRVFSTSNGYTNSVTYAGSGNVAIRDLGSMRMRAGWSWNGLLPYAFAGAALGMADITRTATVSGVQVNTAAQPGFTNIPFNYTLTSAQPNHFIYGYALGVGVDVMLFGGLFVRGEWEYLKFVAPVNTSVSAVRGGVGYKF